MYKIFWIAGENSGDVHASMVIENLKQTGLSIQNYGIGGYRMQSKGFIALFPFKRFNVMGFFEVIKHIKFFQQVEKDIKKDFIKNKPNLVVLVDYPGLNLRIARIAKDLDIPVFYYICPQFWAWKHKRVYKLAEYTDFVASILPFESELLSVHRVQSEYVGHPVLEELNIEINREQFAKDNHLDLSKKWISFFPGSRISEIEKLLPIYLKSIKKFEPSQYTFLISKATNIKDHIISSIVESEKINLHEIKLITGYNHELMKFSDFLVIKSGTSTIEAAILGTPFIICYKANYFSYLIGKKLVKIKYIGLPNILLEDKAVPELIQQEVNPNNIYSEVLHYLNDSHAYSDMQKNLNKIQMILGSRRASEVTCEKIVEFLTGKR